MEEGFREWVTGFLGRIGPMHLAVAAVAMLVMAGSSYALVSLVSDDEGRASGATEATFDDETIHVTEQGLLDSDGDGLSDAQENFIYGSDAESATTSGTRIPDGWLARYGFDLFDPLIESVPAARPPADALPESYGNQWPTKFTMSLWEVYSFDRPTDWDEDDDGPYYNDIDPRDWDNNDDGIPDGFLLYYGLDPLGDDIADRTLDGGSMPVKDAFFHGTDPTKKDTDGDGIDDLDEIQGPADPTKSGTRFEPTDPTRYDTAATGVCDGYLVRHGLDPTIPQSATEDQDNDGASTREEFLWSLDNVQGPVCSTGSGLDPLAGSTLGISIPDGWLIYFGLSPLESGVPTKVTQTASTDPGPSEADTSGLDDVGLTVLDEYNANRPHDWDEPVDGPWWGGTDPDLQDSDGDGLGDAWETRGYWVRASTEVGPSERGEPYWTNSDPTSIDSDGDGLSDQLEVTPFKEEGGVPISTDARRKDTDFDGISDAAEVSNTLGLDPTVADSAGDFLRDGKRLELLQSRALQYQESLDYEYPGPPGVSRSVSDWIGTLDGAEGIDPQDTTQIVELFGPRGNADGDTDGEGEPIPNILDPDMDGDGLLNGWEVDPITYRFSRFPSEFASERSKTDILNPDTDGDRLRDGWEVDHGLADHSRGIYNLDPADWDSDGDGVDDGREDPDEEQTLWVTYAGSLQEPTFGSAVEVGFNNFQEQQVGTDPNKADTDDDGLRDGWKAFWSLEYPFKPVDQLGVVYPGAWGGALALPDGSSPVIGRNQANDAPIDSYPYVRYVLDDSQLASGEDAVGWTDVDNPNFGESGKREVVEVSGALDLTFQIVQGHGTNPYMADFASGLSSDGDKMPDAWELLHQSLPSGVTDSAGRDFARCVEGASVNPLVPDGDEDSDGDGLSNLEEYVLGSNPLCKDSDLGGVDDGVEYIEAGLNPADPGDDKNLLNKEADSDGDGITDFDELTVTRTDPFSVDSDGDGLLDGENLPPRTTQHPDGFDPSVAEDADEIERLRGLGIAYSVGSFSCGQCVTFLGEVDQATNPLDWDDSESGIPSGWLAAHRRSMESGSAIFIEHYRFAMPSWWDLSTHGPWWGGLAPGEDLAAARSDKDLDNDGLWDRRSDGTGYEDPMPSVNKPNALRSVDYTLHDMDPPAPNALPTDAGLDPLTARLLAQAFINPIEYGQKAYARASPGTEPSGRVTACITWDDAPDTLRYGEGSAMIKGTVRRCSDSAGLPGVTVQAVVGDDQDGQVIGAGFTDSMGRFSFPARIVTEQVHEVLPGTGILRGVSNGTATWKLDMTKVPVGDDDLRLVSYATPMDFHHVESRGLERAVSTLIQRVEVTTPTGVQVNVPDEVDVGKPFTVVVEVSDGVGDPRADHVIAAIAGTTRSADATGGTARLEFPEVPATTAWVGKEVLHVSTVPQGSGSDSVDPAEYQQTVTIRQRVTLEPGAVTQSADAGDTVTVRGRVTTTDPLVATLGLVTVTIRDIDGEDLSVTTAVDANSRYTAQFVLPEGATLGTYDVIHEIAKTDTASDDVTTSFLTVRARPWFSDVSRSNVALGGDVQVEARLLEPDGRPVVDVPVRIEFDGFERTVRSDQQGRVSSVFDAGEAVAPRLQSFSFAGDSQHVAVSHQMERDVVSSTVLTIDPDRVARGTTVNITMRLEDSVGNQVRGAPLSVFWEDVPVRHAVTDGDGNAMLSRFIPADIDLGLHRIEATYDGAADGSLLPSVAITSWEVVAQPTIELPNGSFDAGTPVPQGRLTEGALDEPLAGFPVTVEESNGNRTVRTVITSSEGWFPLFQVDPGSDSLPSSHVFHVSFAGDSQYEQAQASTTLAVRAKTSMDPSIPATLALGKEVLGSITLWDGSGGPVEGGTVDVWLGETRIGTSSVDDSRAKVSILVPMGTPEGPGDLIILYSGSDTHTAVQQSLEVNIKVPVNLEVSPTKKALPGEALEVTLRLTRDGEPVPFAAVFLVVDGRPGGIEGVTDEDGNAMFTLIQGNQTMQVGARYEGDAEMEPVFTYLRIHPDSLLTATEKARIGLWIAGGVAVMVGGAAYVWYYMRRNPLEKAFRFARKALARGTGTPADKILLAYRRLEDAAIGHGLMDRPAVTPRKLEQAVVPSINPSAHGSLDELISMFEAMRYSEAEIEEAHTVHAERCFDAVIKDLVHHAFRRPVQAVAVA